jgi:hypothetical protein
MGDYIILVSFGLNEENRKLVDVFIEQQGLEFCYDIWDKREWIVLYKGSY